MWNSIETDPQANEDIHLAYVSEAWPQGYKTFFMLNSVEHEICLANKSQITNNCKLFLAEHS